MSVTATDRESATAVFREWLASLPVSGRVVAQEGTAANGAVREKAWLDEIDEISGRP